MLLMLNGFPYISYKRVLIQGQRNVLGQQSAVSTFLHATEATLAEDLMSSEPIIFSYDYFRVSESKDRFCCL